MGTNIDRLRRNGAPPSADDARVGKPALRPLQVRIPTDVFEDFSDRTGREFGFSHRGMKQLILKMWKAYKAKSM